MSIQFHDLCDNGVLPEESVLIIDSILGRGFGSWLRFDRVFGVYSYGDCSLWINGFSKNLQFVCTDAIWETLTVTNINLARVRREEIEARRKEILAEQIQWSLNRLLYTM